MTELQINPKIIDPLAHLKKHEQELIAELEKLTEKKQIVLKKARLAELRNAIMLLEMSVPMTEPEIKPLGLVSHLRWREKTLRENLEVFVDLGDKKNTDITLALLVELRTLLALADKPEMENWNEKNTKSRNLWTDKDP